MRRRGELCRIDCGLTQRQDIERPLLVIGVDEFGDVATGRSDGDAPWSVGRGEFGTKDTDVGHDIGDDDDDDDDGDERRG
jgi:hypothetical protein